MSHYMTPGERLQLEALSRAKIPVTNIAKLLGFSRQTIYNELKLGAVQVVRDIHGIQRDVIEYSAQKANQIHAYNQTAKGKPLKIGNDHALAQRLEELMLGIQTDGTIDPAKRYSPAAALAQARKEGYAKRLSTNTLYRYIYTGVLARMTAKQLWEGPRPRKKKNAGVLRVAHPQYPSIDVRPEKITLRYDIGHWEMDLVIGRSGKGYVLLTLTERKSRMEIVRRLPDRKADTIRKAIDQLEADYPAFGELFKTVTTDNGSEFLAFEQLTTSINGGKRFDLYYCHSYAAWEKGTNERNNRMLRRKWPKGTPFTDVSQAEIDDYVEWLNNYPRKSLGWSSPIDIIQTQYSERQLHPPEQKKQDGHRSRTR